MKTYFKTLKQISFGNGDYQDSGYPGLSYKTPKQTILPQTKFVCEARYNSKQDFEISCRYTNKHIGIASKQDLAEWILSGSVIQMGICKKGGEHDPFFPLPGGWLDGEIDSIQEKIYCKKCKEFIV